MKKLMIAAAIVCAAAFAQAATYTWRTFAGDYMTDDSAGFSGDELEGFIVYAFDANQYSLASFTAAASKKDTLAGALSHALSVDAGQDNTVNGQTFSFTGTGIGDDGGEGTQYINAYLAIFDDEQKYFHTYTIDPIKVNEVVTATGADLGIGDHYIDELPGDGSYWTEVKAEDVPEPTSGLLLLLGMAGLALKRKRA